MTNVKELLHRKIVGFQRKIAEQAHALQEQREHCHTEQQELLLRMVEVVDAVDALVHDMQSHADRNDAVACGWIRNGNAIRKKILRSLRAYSVHPLDFPDNRADPHSCSVVDTRPSDDLPAETIVEVLKQGYIDKRDDSVLRRAEVVTVRHTATG